MMLQETDLAIEEVDIKLTNKGPQKIKPKFRIRTDWVFESEDQAKQVKKILPKALEFYDEALGPNPILHVYTKGEHEVAQKNGQIVHLLDGYIKDLDLLDRLMPTSSMENKEILSPAVKDVLDRLYKIRQAKP